MAALQLRARLRPRVHAALRRRARPALALCTALGADMAPDWRRAPTTTTGSPWSARTTPPSDGGRSPTRAGCARASPRRMCSQAGTACSSSPARRFQVEAPRDLQDLCKGLEDVQRAGCVTGAAVIGPSDPAEQLRICAALDATADAESCVRGTKVQNLLTAPPAPTAAHRRLRAVPGRGARRLLRLAREGARGRDRRPLRPHGLPRAPVAGRPAVLRRRRPPSTRRSSRSAEGAGAS